MSENEVFQCPNCAAPLRATGAETQVECPYCGTTVIVPAALRPAAPAVPPPPPAYIPPPLGYTGPAGIPTANRLAQTAFVFGILGLVFTCLFFPVGIGFDLTALILAWQYDRQRQANPQQPANPIDADRVRAGRMIATVGLALFAGVCLLLFVYSSVATVLGIPIGGTPVPTVGP